MGSRIMSGDDKAAIERLYQTTSDAIIGEIIGKSRDTVRRYRRKHGLQKDTLRPIVSPRNNKEPGTPATQTDGTCPVAKKLLSMRW